MKNTKLIAYCIVALIAIIVLFSLFKGCGKNEILNNVADIELLKSNLQNKEFELKQWRTKDSINVAQIKSLQVDVQTLVAANKNLFIQLKKIGIKNPEKNLQSATIAKTKTSETIVTKIDTVYIAQNNDYADGLEPKIDTGYKFIYKSKYLSLSGFIKAPNVTIDYQKEDSLVFVKHYKKNWFLGAKKTYLTAYSTDVHTQITGLKNIDISAKKKRFNLSIGGGYVYNGTNFQPAIGIYLGCSLIRF